MDDDPHETAMTALLDRAMGAVTADDTVVALAAVRGRRLVARRRRRRAGTVGLLVAAAVAGAATLWPSDGGTDPGFAAADPAGLTVVGLDSPTTTPHTTPTTTPDTTPDTTTGTTPTVLTPQQVTDHLAAVLPGPSTPLTSARDDGRTGTGQALAGVSVTRAYAGGTVSVYTGGVGWTDPARGAQMCAEVGNGHAEGTNCVVTDAGWLLTSVVRPDVAGAGPEDRTADVRLLGRDGTQLHLRATNVPPDGGDPVSTAPVLSVEQLTALATAPGWYG